MPISILVLKQFKNMKTVLIVMTGIFLMLNYLSIAYIVTVIIGLDLLTKEQHYAALPFIAFSLPMAKYCLIKLDKMSES